LPRLLRKPPRIKVLEAIGSLGDGRLNAVSDECARVTSSRGDKVYKVVVLGDGRVYSSDNGTRLRGYIGYPIIAFLMFKGVIPIDRDVMNAMKGVPWKDLNEKYKRYAIVEDIVVRRAERMGVKREIIYDYINIVMKKLGLMKLYFDESLENYECKA
jgi:hypothetical protein